MTGRLITALGLVTGIAICSLPDSSQAFRRWKGLKPHVAPTLDAPILHWDLREFPDCRIPVLFGKTTSDLGPSEQAGQVLIAMHAWEDISPARIGFVLTGHSLPQPPSYHVDGYNTISWNDSSLDRPEEWMGKKTAIAAMTYVYFDTLTGRILEADIRFNNESVEWHIATHDQQAFPLFGQADVRTIALHEFGHFIGLDHPQDDFGDWDHDYLPWQNFPGPEDQDHDSDGYLDAPLMDPDDERFTRWVLNYDDRDGCNFLYNPDLGDAPDPYIATFNQFPSLVHQSLNQIGVLNERPRYAPGLGASHFFSIRGRQPNRNYSYEWLGFPFQPQLGDNFDSECESRQVDRDAFDDGVTITPNPTVFRKPVDISVWIRHATDALGNSHDYTTQALFENTWLDFNLDGDWDESERFLRRSLHPAPASGPNATAWARIDTTLVLPDILANATRPMWLRARVDWAENGGDGVKIEPGLVGPRGAAQFGEVEDYPIRMLKPKVQLIVPNGSGQGAQGVAMVVPGQAGPGQNYQSQTTAGDCPTVPFANPSSQTYDGLGDETTVTYTSTGISPGTHVHVGRAQTDIPGQTLRAHWIPDVGPPGIDDWIPTVNATALDLQGPGGGDRRTRVVVGAVNTNAGGVISGDPGAFLWNDSMYVQVIARIAPGPIPLENLSLCHPLVTSLETMPLGARWITPQSPFQADLPTAMSSGALVLEVQSAWSVNAATSTMLIEFDDVASQVTGVPDPGAAAKGLRLRAMPTPTRGPTVVEFTLPRESRVSLGIYDLAGRRQRLLSDDRVHGAGTIRIEWDGLSKEGRRLPAGLYFLRLEVDGRRETAHVVVLE